VEPLPLIATNGYARGARTALEAGSISKWRTPPFSGWATRGHAAGAGEADLRLKSAARRTTAGNKSNKINGRRINIMMILGPSHMMADEVSKKLLNAARRTRGCSTATPRRAWTSCLAS